MHPIDPRRAAEKSRADALTEEGRAEVLSEDDSQWEALKQLTAEEAKLVRGLGLFESYSGPLAIIYRLAARLNEQQAAYTKLDIQIDEMLKEREKQAEALAAKNAEIERLVEVCRSAELYLYQYTACTGEALALVSKLKSISAEFAREEGKT